MTATRIYIVLLLLLLSVFCCAQSAGDTLTSPQYREQLDQLLAATSQLDSTSNQTPNRLRDLPESWRVHIDEQDFEISTEGLHRDIRRYETEKSAANASAIRARLQSLRDDLGGFERQPADVSANRRELNSILARPEFRDVRGPSWLDRFKQWLLTRLLRLLDRLFRVSAIPAISKFFVYGLMIAAALALGYFVYRAIWVGSKVQSVVPRDLPVSAKDWVVWLSEARAAAAKGEWREAIHLAYWAGISFLERQGTWKPDRARTPREYLRLISPSSEHRDTLMGLTRIFELAWYAKRGANEKTFSQTLEALQKLGCQ
jgi:hypothetical protein